MKIQPAVKKETARIALGTCALSLVMIAVFALLGQLDSRVWLGTLLGALVAVLNFFLMALSVQRAASRMNGVTLPPEEEPGEETDEAPAPKADVPELKQAKQAMQLSYTGRMLMLVAFAVLVLSLQSVFHPIPAAIALLFPRVIVSVIGLMDHKRKEEA